jgi:hypothetical protein
LRRYISPVIRTVLPFNASASVLQTRPIKETQIVPFAGLSREGNGCHCGGRRRCPHGRTSGRGGTHARHCQDGTTDERPQGQKRDCAEVHNPPRGIDSGDLPLAHAMPTIDFVLNSVSGQFDRRSRASLPERCCQRLTRLFARVNSRSHPAPLRPHPAAD